MPPASYVLPDPQPPRKPDAAFLLSHPAHAIALGFGSGLAPVAPGTFGTLWAWIAFVVLQHWLPPTQMGELVALSLPLGWWACSVTAQHLRSADPSAIVWDEVAAFWVVLWLLMPAGWVAQLWAFLLFRFFDMVKPGPMGWADRRFKGAGWRGGFGIMVDDVVAAFCTLLVIALWRTLW
jgi:phosphatidylglycerophosphatase A